LWQKQLREPGLGRHRGESAQSRPPAAWLGTGFKRIEAQFAVQALPCPWIMPTPCCVKRTSAARAFALMHQGICRREERHPQKGGIERTVAPESRSRQPYNGAEEKENDPGQSAATANRVQVQEKPIWIDAAFKRYPPSKRRSLFPLRCAVPARIELILDAFRAFRTGPHTTAEVATNNLVLGISSRDVRNGRQTGTNCRLTRNSEVKAYDSNS